MINHRLSIDRSHYVPTKRYFISFYVYSLNSRVVQTFNFATIQSIRSPTAELTLTLVLYRQHEHIHNNLRDISITIFVWYSICTVEHAGCYKWREELVAVYCIGIPPIAYLNLHMYNMYNMDIKYFYVGILYISPVSIVTFYVVLLYLIL